MKVKMVRIENNKKIREDVFEVAKKSGMTVLDVLEEIYRHHDSTIAYRYSCRTGICGTCSMMINGKFGLSCMKTAEPGNDDFLHLRALLKGETVVDLIKKSTLT